jgi:hypothetical protein
MAGFPLTSQLIGSDIGWNGPDATASQQAFYTLANQILAFQNQLKNVAATSVVGVTNGSDAKSGQVGEFLTTTAPATSVTGWVTSTAQNIVSLTLTAGDWDVSAQTEWNASAALTGSGIVSALSLTSASFDLGNSALMGRVDCPILPTTTWGQTHTIGPRRISINGSTTIYLVGFITFSAGTPLAGGTIRARRVR